MTTEPEHHEHHEEYHYFVDKIRYEFNEAHISGAAIKSKLPEDKRLDSLFLVEANGEERLINDDATVSLKEGPKHFVTKKLRFVYFVDGEKYESDEPHTTGAIIKSKLPEAKRTYALYLEGNGKEPDQLINDDTSISFERGREAKRFYTVPPASFGAA